MIVQVEIRAWAGKAFVNQGELYNAGEHTAVGGAFAANGFTLLHALNLVHGALHDAARNGDEKALLPVPPKEATPEATMKRTAWLEVKE